MLYNKEILDQISLDKLYKDKKMFKKDSLYYSPLGLGKLIKEIASNEFVDTTNHRISLRTGINKSTLSKIFNDEEYIPSKDTLIAIIFAYKVDSSGSELLLNRAGYSFNSMYKRDLLISYFIKKGMFDIDSLNYCLDKYNLKKVGN